MERPRIAVIHNKGAFTLGEDPSGMIRYVLFKDNSKTRSVVSFGLVHPGGVTHAPFGERQHMMKVFGSYESHQLKHNPDISLYPEDDDVLGVDDQGYLSLTDKPRVTSFRELRVRLAKFMGWMKEVDLSWEQPKEGPK